MLEIKGGKKEQILREYFNEEFGGQVPTGKVLDLFKRFLAGYSGDEEWAYSSFNGILKRCASEVGYAEETIDEVKVYSVDDLVVTPIKVEDMEFPHFGLFKTGKIIDQLFSDHEVGGGIYGGTVNIVIGESGVGKSTVMLDTLAEIVEQNPETRILYISSEMTRNDIMFYYKKTPAIGKVPTLLLMDYVKDGRLAPVLEKSFNGDYDIILLDSYQDVLVKLKEVHGWKSTKAESWLTNMMIDAAEKSGCAVLAIQHMTKGGQYVGSTYLKHATTAMLEIRFDTSGQRFVEFSKNRRGGSGTGKRLYYSLNGEGKVVYDDRRWKETEEMRDFEAEETVRQHDLTAEFEKLFLGESDEETGYSVVPSPTEFGAE